MATKTKTAVNGAAPLADGPTVRFVDIRQRHMEAWSKAFQDYGGPTLVGVANIAGAAVRALVDAGILEEPAWTLEDVDDAHPGMVIHVYRQFDELYAELMTVPKN